MTARGADDNLTVTIDPQAMQILGETMAWAVSAEIAPVLYQWLRAHVPPEDLPAPDQLVPMLFRQYTALNMLALAIHPAHPGYSFPRQPPGVP